MLWLELISSATNRGFDPSKGIKVFESLKLQISLVLVFTFSLEHFHLILLSA
jgi:hypothetical protein